MATVGTWTRPSAPFPPEARELAQDSLAGALAVSARVGDGRLATAAQDAFVSGMHTAALVAAAVALAGASSRPSSSRREEREPVREAVAA